MPWWRKFLALLGLTDDARVHVRASGIDIVITGEPKLVRRVLEAVREELEGRRKRSKKGASLPVKFDTDSHMVLPSELDDMDSPYIIPEHRQVGPDIPVPGGTQVAMDEDIVGERLAATQEVDQVGEPTTVDLRGSKPAPIPQISPAATTAPETTTDEREVAFAPDSVTDGGSVVVSEEFTDSGSERGTDPDLSAEAQQLPKHMLPRTES